MIDLLHKYRLDHIAFGWLLMVPVYVATGSLLMAWGAQSFYWLGREIRDHEVKTRIKLPQYWYRSWNFLAWSIDGMLDFLLPVIVNGIIAALISKVIYGGG